MKQAGKIYYPPDSRCIADSGYQGLGDGGLGLRLTVPYKKPRGRDLSAQQKVFNHILGSVRVKAEHVICHMKYNRIMSDQLRTRKGEYDDLITNTVGGLYNYKRASRSRN